MGAQPKETAADAEEQAQLADEARRPLAEQQDHEKEKGMGHGADAQHDRPIAAFRPVAGDDESHQQPDILVEMVPADTREGASHPKEENVYVHSRKAESEQKKGMGKERETGAGTKTAIVSGLPGGKVHGW